MYLEKVAVGDIISCMIDIWYGGYLVSVAIGVSCCLELIIKLRLLVELVCDVAQLNIRTFMVLILGTVWYCAVIIELYLTQVFQ